MYAVYLLDGKCLSQHLHTVDIPMIEEDSYLLSQLLLASLPEDGVAIHTQNTVARIIYHRVAYSLNILAISTQMIIAMHHAIDRIRIDIICKHLERIGMSIHRVLLAVVNNNGTVCRHHITRDVFIITIPACEHVLVNDIVVNDIAKSLGRCNIIVPHNAIAYKPLAIVGKDTTVQQVCVLSLCVIITQFRIDMVLAVLYVRRANDMRDSSLCIIMKRVRDKYRLWLCRRRRVYETDIIVEDRFVCGRTIFSPVACQFIIMVTNSSAFKEVT